MTKLHAKFLLLLPGAGFLAASLWVLPSRANPRSYEKTITSAHRYHADEIKGTIIDAYGKPLVDVKVSIKGTAVSAATNLDGAFTIKADKGDVLVFTLRNFYSVEKTVGESSDLNNIVMVENTQMKDASYHILYGEQKKSLTVQSVAELRSSELRKTYSSNLLGILNGRMAGLNVGQFNGKPGDEDFNGNLRGFTPMIVVDGFPARDMLNVNPEQIESVTLLKDALATAMYGMRGANGVLLVTTRKGEEGPQRLSFTATAGITKSTKQFKRLNAYDYASLYNEALANDGKQPAYTPADLDHYKNGTDPYGHPNVNWEKELLRNQSTFQRYDLEISGGREIAKYYVNLDYTNQQGLFKTADFNKYNTNADMKRYIFRSNVDVKVNRSISASVNILGRIQTANEPGAESDVIMRNIFITPNNAYPVKNPDGSLGGSAEYTTNMYGQAVMSGYQNLYTRDLSADLNLRGDLSDLVKGLWIKGSVSFWNNFTERITRNKANATYKMRVGPAGDTTYQKFGDDGNMSNSSGDVGTVRFLYTDAQLGYTRQFGDHGLNIVYTVSNDNRTMSNQLPQNFTGTAGRLEYNFREKYMFEFAMAFNGTNRYHKRKRYGWFPAFGLGWNLAKESFLKADWLNELKIRSSYGTVGLAFNSNRFTFANDGYFVYNQYYEGGSAYNFSTTATSFAGVREGRLANENVSWEKANKFNLGVDIALLNNTITLTAEYYNNKHYDLLQTRGKATALMGNTYPLENIGINRYRGAEFTLGYQNNIRKFNYFISGNLSMMKTKVEFSDEQEKPYTWMFTTGNPVNARYGYLSDGLFQNAAEIAAAPKMDGYNAVPGDIRYKDLNGDGRINQFDVTRISNDKPSFFYGVNLGFSWNGFDFSALIQGAGNRQGQIVFQEFNSNGKGNAYERHLGRWTPATAATATNPRLTVGENVNNTANSDYWWRDVSYFRLKNTELGYTFPNAVTRRIKVASIRVFVNGTNLFTHSKFKESDPENFTGLYPIQKALFGGLNIKF